LVALAAAIHFHAPTPYDADTSYHAAVGFLIREHGILRAFPWTPFSWLADHYADKELLFHLLYVPLGGLGWITASQLVGTLGSATVLLTLYLVLRAERVPLAGAWALLPAVASAIFFFRLALVRPHLFSIALALAALWAASRGRLVILALVSAIYPWAYVAWQLPVVLAAVAEVARVAAGERLRWRPIAVAAGAVALGIALHPNAVNLVRFNWIVLEDVLLRNAWGRSAAVELGTELLPLPAAEWARLMLATIALLAVALVLAWRGRRATSVPLAFALAAVAFGALTLRSAKFADYFAPFSAAALALSAGPLRRGRLVLGGALAAGALYAGPVTLETYRGLGEHADDLPPVLAASFRAQVPPGAQVFTCEMAYTGKLLLALPDRRFVVALDPTLFQVKDPELYRLWMEIPRQAPPDSAALIRSRFGARYVLCTGDDERWNRLFRRLMSSPGARVLHLDALWMLVDLGAGTAP
jgi:hypothetical protein